MIKQGFFAIRGKNANLITVFFHFDDIGPDVKIYTALTHLITDKTTGLIIEPS